MPRGKAIDTFKRDNILMEFMRQHKGEENIVSSREIPDYMQQNGYSVKRHFVCSILRKIMYERNAPICHTNANGYYWAKTKQEIEKAIADLESRRNSMQEHIDHLKGFIIG